MLRFLARFSRYLEGSFFIMDGWCFSLGIISFSRCYALSFNGIPFYIARLLAAKFGTCLRLSPCMSSLLWVDDSQLELTLFSLLFPVDC